MHSLPSTSCMDSYISDPSHTHKEKRSEDTAFSSLRGSSFATPILFSFSLFLVASVSMPQREKEKSNAAETAGRTQFWKWTLLGVSVALVVGAAWRTVYMSNQKELQLRRALRKSQQLHDALTEVPARRFSTLDVRPAAAQKNELMERYA
ncbi:hypothetical protein ABB37_01177 [Leptomonas pyrrhocoris]|uniref:Transmembrane protein n=1 Tax=Leptomonas pyrrhocoris TaxID=157538 RepID=A0A0M9G8H6_LEPPY|nr:hypothetical protein ABB37_01177 [Leptomonas pyrrhocoris]KPA84666.1 hypothetical protein ABB37_01177 [Leptomonas pyrrhocoris]|eukprot:XP_015663105.1 hypothetical protein ABB37_01177 [Leptomonas pyrrhocoris]